MTNAYDTGRDLAVGLLAFAPAVTFAVGYLVAVIRQEPAIIAYGGVGAMIVAMAAIGCAMVRDRTPHGDERTD